MTLLERIIESAERDGSVSSLLRMMKTLAARTGADQLGKWANNELTGYGVDDTVPQYRGPFEIQVTATFRNSLGIFRITYPLGPGGSRKTCAVIFFLHVQRTNSGN